MNESYDLGDCEDGGEKQGGVTLGPPLAVTIRLRRQITAPGMQRSHVNTWSSKVFADQSGRFWFWSTDLVSYVDWDCSCQHVARLDSGQRSEFVVSLSKVANMVVSAVSHWHAPVNTSDCMTMTLIRASFDSIGIRAQRQTCIAWCVLYLDLCGTELRGVVTPHIHIFLIYTCT